MSNDAILVLECLFQTIWSLFTSWHFPGTDVTPASFFLFLISAGIGLRYVLQFLHSPNAGATGFATNRNQLAVKHNDAKYGKGNW